MGKEGIILVGIDHADEHLQEVLKVIEEHKGKVKTIGIEGIFVEDAKILNEYANRIGNQPEAENICRIVFKIKGTPPFWADAAIHAIKNGMQIVPIDSRYADKKFKSLLLSNSEKFEKLDQIAENYFKNEISFRQAMKEFLKIKIVRGVVNMNFTSLPIRDKFMIRRILKQKPDMVIVGAGHGIGISKVVPVRKRISLFTPSIPAKIYFKSLRIAYNVNRSISAFRKKLKSHVRATK